MGEEIDLVLSAGVFPGSQSTAAFLARSPSEAPTFWLRDLNQSTKGPLGQLPTGGSHRRFVGRLARSVECEPR